MRTNLYKICFSVVIVLLTACTRNDGNIGELYGMWRVATIEVGDEPLKDYSGTIYFEFQSNVFCQKQVNELNHNNDDRFASWHYQSTDEIILDFSDYRYIPFATTGMQKGQNLVKIEKCKGKDLEMSYEAPEGTYYRYKLKKW